MRTLCRNDFSIFYCTLLLVLLVTPSQGEVSPTQQTIMDDTVAVWSQFRWGQTSGGSFL